MGETQYKNTESTQPIPDFLQHGLHDPASTHAIYQRICSTAYAIHTLCVPYMHASVCVCMYVCVFCFLLFFHTRRHHHANEDDAPRFPRHPAQRSRHPRPQRARHPPLAPARPKSTSYRPRGIGTRSLQQRPPRHNTQTNATRSEQNAYAQYKSIQMHLLRLCLCMLSHTYHALCM